MRPSTLKNHTITSEARLKPTALTFFVLLATFCILHKISLQFEWVVQIKKKYEKEHFRNVFSKKDLNKFVYFNINFAHIS